MMKVHNKHESFFLVISQHKMRLCCE